MATVKISVNGTPQEIDVDPAMPILWVVRERLGLSGTKFGCGIAQCGACTVHLDGEPVRSCSTPISAADGKDITTIEGIAAEDGTLSKVQQAWINEQVPQCGYCQSGQIMSATALLKETPRPTDEQINAYMAGNVCRCGMYGRIRKAIKVAAGIEPSATQETPA
ncbi:(2Fe-2S)-binding protein [Qipengyuania sp. DSG2-2]|uniref:(2Fe-2S)-binding protein n=1 Tax=Qipengyuania sp. DGS2-2 TaxID=3349631 RepID=UPI0036D209DF